jgi:hypothetical protein
MFIHNKMKFDRKPCFRNGDKRFVREEKFSQLFSLHLRRNYRQLHAQLRMLEQRQAFISCARSYIEPIDSQDLIPRFKPTSLGRGTLFHLLHANGDHPESVKRFFAIIGELPLPQKTFFTCSRYRCSRWLFRYRDVRRERVV